MARETDTQIQELAETLWDSAARPYGAALDFWLMAEDMVLEMMSAGVRAQNRAISDMPDRLPGVLPESVPVEKISELAKCMWHAAGWQYNAAQDVWLAAERHVLTMLRATATPETTTPVAKWADELASLPPQAYVERIRISAYFLWEATGRQYGSALDYWLRAEEEMLGGLAAAARARGDAMEGTAEAGGKVPPDPVSAS